MSSSHDLLDAFSDVLAVLYAAPTPARAAAELAQPLQRLFVGSPVGVVWTPDPPEGNAVEPAADNGLVLAARLDGGVLDIRLPSGSDSDEETRNWLECLLPHLAAAFAGVSCPDEPFPASDCASWAVIRLGADGRAGDALPAGLAQVLAKHFRWRPNGSLRHAASGLRVWEDPRAIDWYRLTARGLTERECEVLHGIAQGQRDAEMAAELGLAVKTVGKHVERILKKLGADSRLGAAYEARVWLNHGVVADRTPNPSSS